jgi:hypothetical protein
MDNRLTILLRAAWEAGIILMRALACVLEKPNPFPPRCERRGGARVDIDRGK